MIEKSIQRELDVLSVKNIAMIVARQREVIKKYLLKLNQHLCADYLFIAKSNEDYSESTSLITLAQQDIVANFSYPLAHSPCERVFESKVCAYPKDVAELFPKDIALTEMGIVGYLGLPIVSESNYPVGILVALFKRELTQVDSFKYSFEVFADHLSTLLQTVSTNEKMQFQNRLLQEVSQSAKVAYWQLDTATEKLQWSRQAYEMFGLGVQSVDSERADPVKFELELEAALALFHPGDRQRALHFFKQVVEGKSADSNTFNIVSASGDLRTVLCKVSGEDTRRDAPKADKAEAGEAKPNASGNPVIGVIQDITDIKTMSEELKSSQRELQEQEKMFLDIMDCSPAVIYVKDINGTYLYANRKYLMVFGITRDDVIGKTDREVFPEHVARVLMENDRKVIQTRSHLELEEQVPQLNGMRLYVSEKFPLTNSEGDVYALCGISTDITDRRYQENQLRQSQKMEAIGQLAGGVAHDFNNQLTSIMGFAELSVASNDVHQIKRYLYKIISSAESSGELTKKLLAFSRKEEGKQDVLDLHQLVKETIELLSHTLDKRISINVQLHAAGHCVTGNKSTLQNALINLGLNARDAMPSGGEIGISSSLCEAHQVPAFFDSPRIAQGNQFIRLDFADTGTGIPEAELARIFEPFFTTKDPGKGTGMGLASVYGCIENMGGAIQVASEVDQGTCFSIFLPLTSSTPECPDLEGIADNDAGSGSKTILLVDDEPAIRKLCAEFFDLLGYKGLFASDGLEAIEQYRQHQEQIDLVILDMIMPVMTGEEAVLKLREINPNVKVVISSGYTAQYSEQELIGRGVSQVIHKPFRMAELKKCMEKVLPQP